MTLKQLIKSIDKKEWQFVIFLIFIIFVLVNLPYLYGYLNAPEDHFYNWGHSISSGDFYVYFSYIQQIKDGNWLLTNNFTSELPQTGTLNLFWLPVGLFARLFNLSPVFAYHFFRLIFIPAFFLVAYLFLSYFFKDKLKRKTSLIFLSCASGIGAYLSEIYNKLYPVVADDILTIYKWPIDLWVSETNTFLTLAQSPHFILTWIMLMGFFLFMLLALSNNKYFYSLIAGLIGLYWFNWHPYYFPSVFAILALYVFFLIIKNYKWHYVWHFLLSLFLSSPFIIYHYYLIKTDLLIGARAEQNLCLTPPLEFVIVGFGFLLVFALIGLIYIVKTKKIIKNEKLLFIAVWFIVGFKLIYAPVAWQRRLLMGLQIPIVILAVIAFFCIFNYAKKKISWFNKFVDYFKYLIIILLISVFSFSTIFNITRDLYLYYQQNYIFYPHNDYKQATNWLKLNNKDNSVILSSRYNGHAITGLINQRVYLGHGHETVFYEEKKQKVDEFFKDQLTDERVIKLLQENNIKYIFYSFYEHAIGDFDPEQKDFLQKVYDGPRIAIYQLK